MSISPEADAIPAPSADETAYPKAKSKKRRTRRRIAKGLAWTSLAFTALLILAEPWLLIPVVTFAIALSLWD